VQGHYAYYGITGNFASLVSFYRGVEETWRRWLDRRSQRSSMPWKRYKLLLRTYPLPQPKIVHQLRHSQRMLF
jgi:hypothetical protein